MKILDAPAYGGARVPAPRTARQYAAAAINRLNADLPTQNHSPDTDLRRDLRLMRARSRHLVKNEPYAKRFVSLATKNVIGPTGFDLRMNVRDPGGQPDLVANRIVLDAFKRWARVRNASVTRKQSWIDLKRLVFRTVVVDGECFIHIVRGFDNPFSYALRLIPTDCVDEDLNRDLGDGREIRMGVEVNAWGAPVAYHVRVKNPVDWFYGSASWGRTERIPAADLIHVYRQDAIQQTRGVPWLFAAISRLNQLGGYEEAELIASRIGASKMGFLIPDPEAPGYDGDDVDAEGNTIMEMEPGSWEQLPPGFKVDKFDPQHPNASFDAFVKAMLRGVAASTDVSYHSISQDLSSANYSSLRAGLLDEHDTWIELQGWFREDYIDEVFPVWLEESMLAGAVPLPLTKFDKFNAPVWRGRRWQWVDPAKEVQASERQVALRIRSRRQIIIDQGGEPDLVWAELEEEERLLTEKGLLPAPQVAAPIPEPGAQVAAE